MTFEDLLSGVRPLGELLTGLVGRGGAVVVATEDRAILARALLVAALGGPRLVIPHSLSSRVLREVARSTGVGYALADAGRDLPPELEALPPPRKGPAPEPGLTIKLPGGNPEAHPSIVHLFTGGSTGSPTVWRKTAGNLLGEGLFLARKYRFSPTDRVLATVPPLHIYGLLFSVVAPLVSGAGVVESTPYFPQEIGEEAGRHGCSILVSSPLHLKAMAVSPPAGVGFRLAFSSGGFLDQSASEDFVARTDTPVVEVYGSTETGGIAARCRAHGESVLSAFEPVVWDVKKDQLRVSSPFLSPGLPRDEEGFFVTGDRVGVASGGGFHLLGRVDGIVKVGGKRVDLMEVKNKLSTLEGVRDAYTFSISVASGRENEVAALVETGHTEAELRRILLDLLEPAAMPRHLRVVARMPTTRTGKYDGVAARELVGFPAAGDEAGNQSEEDA